MIKFNKKVTAIIGTATLVVGLMAFPVLAQTTGQQGTRMVWTNAGNHAESIFA